MVEELARAKGLWRRVDELFPKPGSGRGYRASAYVKPLVWMLQAGGRRLEDVRELRAEHEVLRRLGLVDHEPPVLAVIASRQCEADRLPWSALM